MSTPYCESCHHFWLLNKSERHHDGRCHRFPPQPVIKSIVSFGLGAGPVDVAWEWPHVTAGGSCAEHKHRELDG